MPAWMADVLLSAYTPAQTRPEGRAALLATCARQKEAMAS
jgi:hypothetical protein